MAMRIPKGRATGNGLPDSKATSQKQRLRASIVEQMQKGIGSGHAVTAKRNCNGSVGTDEDEWLGDAEQPPALPGAL